MDGVSSALFSPALVVLLLSNRLLIALLKTTAQRQRVIVFHAATASLRYIDAILGFISYIILNIAFCFRAMTVSDERSIKVCSLCVVTYYNIIVSI